MSSPYLGEIVLFAGNFAPRGWAFCDGSSLTIRQNTALYAILGVTYGGDGQTTFNLPDLRGRAPVHFGQGPGLSNNYTQGQKAGTETVGLTVDQLPPHTHAARGFAGLGNTASPANAVWAEGPSSGSSNKSVSPSQFSTGGSSATMSATALQATGGNQGHTNLQPTVALNYIIAITGLYPTRS